MAALGQSLSNRPRGLRRSGLEEKEVDQECPVRPQLEAGERMDAKFGAGAWGGGSFSD